MARLSYNEQRAIMNRTLALANASLREAALQTRRERIEWEETVFQPRFDVLAAQYANRDNEPIDAALIAEVEGLMQYHEGQWGETWGR